MSTQKTSNVTAGEVVSAVQNFTNEDATNKKFNLSADVRYNNENGKAVVASIENGQISKLDNQSASCGSFSCGANMAWFNFGATGLSPEEIKEAAIAVVDFISEVTDAVSKKSTVNE